MSLSAHLSDIYKLPVISLPLPLAWIRDESWASPDADADVDVDATVANLINDIAYTRVVYVMRSTRLIYASYVSIFITSCKNEPLLLPPTFIIPRLELRLGVGKVLNCKQTLTPSKTTTMKKVTAQS